MAQESNQEVLPQFPPSRPSKLSYVVGAVLFVLFCVFVVSQPVITPETQQAAAAAKKQG